MSIWQRVAVKNSGVSQSCLSQSELNDLSNQIWKFSRQKIGSSLLEMIIHILFSPADQYKPVAQCFKVISRQVSFVGQLSPKGAKTLVQMQWCINPEQPLGHVVWSRYGASQWTDKDTLKLTSNNLVLTEL